jgi:cysteine-rich repeat protein
MLIRKGEARPGAAFGRLATLAPCIAFFITSSITAGCGSDRVFLNPLDGLSSVDGVSAVCGDGMVQASEQCEPPGTPRCDLSCRRIALGLSCGNGSVDPGEECEDGNVQSGDGCSENCLMELCGNGRIDFGELCEPPHTDTCNERCQTVPAAGRRGVCGNGLQEGAEECDDGNTLEADGCSGGCELEVCGNGRLDPAELCEPPNTPFCDARCVPRIERCGDRMLGTEEQCDDGNVQDGDGCSARCELEFCNNGRLDVGEECEPPGTFVCDAFCRRITRFCGNRFIEDGEECDDGNVLLGDGCDARCELEFCGNGRIDPGEECELPDSVVCNAFCSLIVTECGNGVLEDGEECDDANTLEADGCSGGCLLEVCGNGRLDAGEFCEPPGTVSCDIACHLRPEIAPAAPP